MASNEKLKGVQIHRPIIYGSHARFLTEAERQVAPPGHTHKWTVFITSACTPPPTDPSSSTGSSSKSRLQTTKPPIDMDYLPGGKDDLSYLIKKVTIKLHETYVNPNRVIDRPPFKVSETGWGEFAVQLRLQFVADSSEKPLTLTHSIKLHHWGVPLIAALPEPIPPAMPVEAGDGTDTAGATPMTDMDSLTSAPLTTANTDVAMADSQGTDAAESSTAPDGAAVTEEKPVVAEEKSEKPLSLPVHSWQYDELVFTDPLPGFYALMNNHPVTPLPVKSKRPRGQRAAIEEDGVKKAKVTVNVKADISTPAATDDTPIPETPLEEQEIIVDVVSTQTIAGVGELSSADVPLEFTQSMEKEEAKRLDEVRIAMVEQMDRWRERLIAKEKELAALRDEMAI